MDLGKLLQQLGDRLRWRRLARHETLFRRGETATAMFAVGHGRVRLIRQDYGAEVVQHVAEAGETLAKAALFAETYHCDAVSEAPSRIAVIPREIVLGRLERDPVFLREFLSALAIQVQDARRRLQIRNVRPARERVWQYLLLRRSGDRLKTEKPVREIAAEIGLTPEAVYRALGALKTEGRLSGRGRDLRFTGGDLRKS